MFIEHQDFEKKAGGGYGTIRINTGNGKYIDAVTGDVVNVTNNTLTVPSIGAANMRVYVCCATGFKGISGKIGNTTTYLK